MMQKIELGTLDQLIIHNIGNKSSEQGVRLGNEPINYDNVAEILNKLITSNFKFDQLFQFHLSPSLELNPVYTIINSMFDSNDIDSFVIQSKNLGQYLYEKSNHPQIKAGELAVFYLKDCRIDDESVDCIGFFKSENKQKILRIEDTQSGYGLAEAEGLSIQKLDKGCLIFNLNRDQGYLIAIVDNTNKNNEAKYWTDEFLNIKAINNAYHQTIQIMETAKQFIAQSMDTENEITKSKKIELLNRSVEYFKNNQQFDSKNFQQQVFVEDGLIQKYQDFSHSYVQQNELEPVYNFTISPKAVKKQQKYFKSVVKLDKNFHLYIHGGQDMIEKGQDDDGRKFYKIYYQQEN
ncbi:MAG: nucleoid-associated protein [Snodgrassella sp.]|nr:nucleoid-associated protein [Snodgrassella sp.]